MERKKDKATRKGRSGGETVRTRRRWRAEEKLAIIKEAKESSSVAEVCRKNSIEYHAAFGNKRLRDIIF